MTEKESILSKIEKLLALSKSPVPAEANAALAKAQELMLRHNIAEAEIHDKQADGGYSKGDFTDERIDYDFTIDKKYICDILQKFFFVKIVNYPQRRFYSIVGRKDNVAIAQFLRGHIKVKFDEAWQAYKSDRDLRGVEGKKEFYYGLWVGLSEKLKSEREVLKREEGLIVVDDKGLIRYMGEEYGKLKSATQRGSSLSDRSAIADGQAAGRNINLNDRIGAGNSNNYSKTLNLN